MKKYQLTILALFLGLGLATSAQNTSKMDKEPLKNIEVTGTAEMEVTPDELYFSISLREYFKDEKNQKDKIDLVTLEKQLIEAIKNAGLPKENLSISGVSGYKEYYGKKKPQHFLTSKQYQLKLTNLHNINDLMTKVDDRGVESVYMSRVEHSKKEEFKKQVKINALKAAKEKANYLVEAIGEKLAGVIEIKEVEDGSYYPAMMQKNYANMRMVANMADTAMEGGEAGIEFQKIKFNYKMLAIFKIQ
jgi:uncharacterized protein